MSKEQHVVLGGSGAIGQAVIKALQQKNREVRAVERTKAVAGVETRMADLLNQDEATEAIAGASHVYMCVGLPYRSNVWQSDWPKIMESVIKACESTGARLIFFDNIYMYGPSPLTVPFDETHAQNPTTKKGVARKEAADALLKAHTAGRIQAFIGRSADFYGPGAVNSPFYIQFLERMLAGKNPQILNSANVIHTYAYTLDNGRALVELAIDQSAYGQVWHLPVGEPVTLQEIITKMNKIMGSQFKLSQMPRPLLGLVGLLVPPVKEVKEMLYQFDDPYVMSDAKFRAAYPQFVTTNYNAGLEAMIDSFKQCEAKKSNL
jgi:nucleoside-diphosphate-sugar epimerase